jgi:hypothetical protein
MGIKGVGFFIWLRRGKISGQQKMPVISRLLASHEGLFSTELHADVI